MAKNALKIAKELAEQQEWAEAYKICNEYIEHDDDEDDDLWELLNPEEWEEIVLLSINCIIKTIWLKDLSSGKCNEDGLIIWNDEYDEIIDLLSDAICGLGGPSLLAEDNKKKIESLCEKVCLMAQQHYFSLLDDVIKNIEDFESYKFNGQYFQGYCCLEQIIKYYFYDLADNLEIEDCSFDNACFSESKKYRNDKLFERALEITQQISNSTNDFPYFDDYDMAYKYLTVTQLVDDSLPDEDCEDPVEKSKRIIRLKHKINLNCDYLNAIYVTRGERVSLCMTVSDREERYKDILKCEKEIQEVESTYNHPPVNKEKFSTVPENKSGGCYVATAVYGSYDCPQVWTLRRYRDYTLAKTWYGRLFVKTYYALSPTIVKWFGNTEWFKNLWRGKLDKMVADLQANGVESTRYEDIEW